MQEAFCRHLVESSLFSPGEPVLVALSGGGDSVALLHLLRGCAPSLPLQISAAHLDHAIRPESAAEADFVRRLCATLDLPLTLVREDVPARAERDGMGLEEAGRGARRAFLTATADSLGCTAVALGHHRDDQAETFLHRLLRGSGATGLSAMRPRRGLFVRPLLPFSKSELRSFLEDRGISFLEDPSNRDPAFTRNRIRHELLPLLNSFNPRIGEHLARLSDRLGREEDYWELEVRRSLGAISRPGSSGLVLDLEALTELHPALRARVIRGALAELRGGAAGITSRHLEAVEGLLLGHRPQGEVHLPGAWVGRRYDELHLLAAPPPLVEPFSFEIGSPGRFAMPGGGEITVEIDQAPSGEGAFMVEFALGALSLPLTVRSFRPGDRIALGGGGGHKKLKELFAEARLSLEARRRWPVVATREKVLWVPGLRRAPGMAPEAGERVLRLAVSGGDFSTNRL